LDPELAIWLVDQKLETVSEAARLADQFYAIRKSVKANTSSLNKPFYNSRFNNNNGFHSSSSSTTNGGNNSTGSAGKQRLFVRKLNSCVKRIMHYALCAYCKKPGHVISVCRKSAEKKTAAGDTQVKHVGLVYNECRPTVHNDIGVFDKLDPGYRNHCITATLIRPDFETKQITLLRDTGALQSLVSKQTLVDNDYVNTGEFRLVRGVSGVLIKVPLVEVKLRSRLVSGTALCGLMDDLPAGVDGLFRE
jgi:hypothetical protein